MTRFRIPRWLRRALEAAIVASLVAIGNLVGARLTAGSELWALPHGATGALVLAPSVVALAVVPVGYTAAMAATRSEAILGAIVAFLVAADVTAIVAGAPVQVGATGIALAAGILAVLLALPAAAVGALAGQLTSPHGFGRRAGGWAALVAAVAAVAALVVVAAVV